MLIYKILARIRAIYYSIILGYKFKTIGRLCKIRGKGIVLGDNVNVGDFCWIETVNVYKSFEGKQNFSSFIRIENNVAMSDFVHISSVDKILIGEGTLIGSKVYIGDHSHGSYLNLLEYKKQLNIPPRWRPLSDIKPIKIGKNCWIGDGVVILAGSEIEDNCVIAANSVVKGKFVANSIIGGAPAKIIKEMI